MQSRLSAWRMPGLILVLMVLLSACATGSGPGAGQNAAQPEPSPAASGTGTAAGAEPPAPATDQATNGGEEPPAEQAPVEVMGLGAPPPAPAAEPAPVPPPSQPEPAAPAPQPAPPAPAAADASPYVFVVNAGPKDRTHPFYGIGSRLGFIVDGVQGRSLVLVRGHTYTFKVDTGVQHDFYFTTSSVGWGAGTYTQGISGQFTYSGIVTFTPTAQTPDLLYYGCRNHKSMGGPIHVVNEGEEARVRAPTQGQSPAMAPAAGGAAPEVRKSEVSEAQVQQKIGFADMFINQSAAARRVQGSGNAEALEALRRAQDKFAASKAALAGGRNDEALALVDEAVRQMTEAGRLVPQETQAEGQRAHFQELLEGTRTFEDSYRRNYEHLKGKKKVRAVDLDAVHAAMDRAQHLADDEQYDEAIAVLTEAQGTLTTALSDLLNDESISYELVFETPKEEYEYELSRYLSYEELVPIAIEQRQPPPQTMELMNQFIEKAKGIKKLSEPEAAKGNYKDAILMLQGATSHIQRALNAAGVR